MALAAPLFAAFASAILAASFNQKRIQLVLKQLKDNLRDGDTSSTNMAICPEWDELIEELKASRELKKSLSKHSSEIAIAAAEMSFAADQLREGIHKEVADTSKIVESANHIHQSVEIMVEQTQEAARFAEEAMETNHRGKQAIDETIPQMEGTREKVNANAELISQLETKSEEIQSVTRVISDIAEQTNLLALNAAIEAARAGEQGRGFAVVADEVRALAAKTSSATQQIGNTVDQINNAIKHAVGNSQELTRVIDQGVSMTQNIQQQLLVIHGQSEEIQNTINTIADSVAANSDHIGHISQIVQVTSDRLENTEKEVSGISGRSLTLAETAEKIYESFRPGELGGVHDAALSEARQASEAIAAELEQLIDSGQLGEADVFDVNYQPVPNTNPKKYHTRYDTHSDRLFPVIQEPILDRNPQFAYAGAVDINGYFP
ncbi:MAG: methyl-accepting chemotaxis protein, partial [Oceanobacter sp.]